jgi:glycosyltransferase involved in cell wall biosynthesis
MARAWIELGHTVTMLCEFPNHPSGIIPQAYHGRLYERTSLDGIDVIRVWVKASTHKSFRNRILFYLSFMFNAALAGLLLARAPYDLVYCSSPPLFTGAAGLLISLLKRLPFFFEVRDLWPESAVALGELSNPLAIRWAERLELSCYRRARCIIVVTEGIRQRLLERGQLADKIVLLPNGANTDLFQFQPDLRLRIRRDLDWQAGFLAIYAGIFGLAQGLETILETARLLQEHPQIRFLLIGDGPKKAEIAAQVARLDLPNLRLLPEQPRESMPGYLSAADVALVPLRRLELFKGALPSKIFDAWACQRPVLISIDGEARRVVEEAQAGIFVPPEDPIALARSLLDLLANQAQAIKMGDNGRQTVVKSFSRRAQARQLIEILEAVMLKEKGVN